MKTEHPKRVAVAQPATRQPEINAENPLPEPKGMYLSHVDIKNFRSCRNTKVTLLPDITLIVGENNSGKSNIIDSIRLITPPSSGRRTRYFEEEDLTRNCGSTTIEISSTYSDLSDIQRGLYFPVMDIANGTCVYKAKMNIERVKGRQARPQFLAGPASGSDPIPEARERIRHVYLAPLRDAQKELDSPDATRLLSIVRLMVSQDDQDDLLATANANLDALQTHKAVSEPAKGIREHLTALTGAIRQQDVDAQFAGMTMRQLIRSLRLKMAESGVELAGVADSGLGYANLLYIATVLLELQCAQDAELTIFLVEEPEAHLHPQLQNVLLEYLAEQARKSLVLDGDRPAGRIQVVCTTHSPNLASSIPVEKVVVTRSNVAGAEHSGTIALPVSSLGIPQNHLSKVSRFLDATKASLLFARNLMLVEGLGECLLMPRLVASTLGKDFRKFAGVTVISVNGTDFEPYVRLLLTPINGVSLVDSLILVTDKDPDKEGNPKIDRKGNMESVADQIQSRDKLHCFVSEFTFEADLLRIVENRAVLRAAYLDQHPRSADKWDSLVATDDPGSALYDQLSSDSSFITKGEFAQTIAQLASEGCVLNAPQYICDAVQKAIEIALPQPNDEANDDLPS